MRLYISPGSPYARIARILIIEKKLSEKVEVILAKTRTTDSPYYQINPSGRVPHLVCDDGLALEDSALICSYLDHLEGQPSFAVPAGEPGLEARRLEALVRSTLDGLAVLGREKGRRVNEQSPKIVLHETDRAKRLLNLWEQQINHPLFQTPLNMVQMVFGCTLGYADLIPEFPWRPTHPKLNSWFEAMSARPSFFETKPPAPK
ncbi:MAG: glutathione S-transferase N-terminal domain-containing protein [Alcaligenaceae bacterium]|nr:glutathione S-transferase N-terminal domain-containing protein [Alcaligenaceae bacterium]